MERFLEKRLKSCLCLGGKKRILGQASPSSRSQNGKAVSLGNLGPSNLGRCSGRRFDPIVIKKITDEHNQQVDEEGMLYIENGQETEVPPPPSAQGPQNGNRIITLGELLAILDAEDSKTQGVIRDAIQESAYILDVLRESGLEDGLKLDDVLMPTWKSSQGPLDPSLFNTLEKKYGDNTTWSRPNRRHLFDSINKVLFEMFRSFVDPLLSVKVDPDWVKYGIVSEVKNLLWIEEKSANDYKLGTSSKLELVCPDFEDEGANMITTELEKMLMDDLIDEIVNIYIE